ncbi:hypothetical protein [Perlucidibaca aquatica]|uniref:hypothetical protein n=1 Tax=Perlucidibaca aquatica TaxID=1852776 RepID=UPI00083B6AEB|nr:hypothetical protein [Perlucidibaca aquatica]
MRNLVFVLLAYASASAYAGIFDELPDLQGKVVAYAGEYEQITCPIGGNYDCLKWPMDLYKTKRGQDICFKPTRYISCSYSCKGLIAIGDDKMPYLYTIENMGGDVKKSGIELYKCPSLY